MVGVVAGVVLLVLLAIMGLSALLADWVRDEAPGPDMSQSPIILEIDLRSARLDQPAATALFRSGPISVIELVATIEAASRDSQVAGLFVRAGDGVTPADAEEIRRALLAFRQSGKTVTAHIQSLTSGSLSPYLAVSAADDIWMHPSGWFAATGLRTEQVFIGDGLTRLGADAQFLQLYEYKGAAEIFTRAGYSEATREATQAWMDSLYTTALTQIAEDRQMTADGASRLINAGPHLASAAVELGFIDGLRQAEDARLTALQATPRSRIQSIEDYAHRLGTPRAGTIIALITGQGPVVDGPAFTGLAAPQTVASDTMAAAIDAAAADSEVRAIVIRLDTGGGSATASDQIAAAILRARHGGIPVVVSLGSVAASGGYYIAAPADHITANAGSLTGSIGVISGKVAMGPALERAGIAFDSVTVGGEFTGAMSVDEGFTEAQRAAIATWAEATYSDFTALVAEGRDLPLSRVDALARGRVWTGAQALELGLIDEIGGFNDAVAAARRLARVSADETVVLRRYPAELDTLEQWRAILSGGMEVAHSLQIMSDLLARPEVQAVLRETQRSNAPIALEAPASEPG